MRKPLQNPSCCLVTGAAGFVGSHLTEKLLSLGYSVVGVDNFFTGHRENMASFQKHPNFTFYERSVTEAGLLRKLQKRHASLDRCFHLAAIVSVPYSTDHPEETLEINYAATRRLLKEAEDLGMQKFVFAGSAAEYGNDQRLPLREEYATEETQRLSPYGEAKFLASRCVAASPKGVALRFFNIYGPRQDPRSPYSGVISRFFELGIRGESLTIFGDGEQTRDFIYISDVVNAYLCVAGLFTPADPALTGIYNVGTGTCTSISDLAEIIRKLTANPSPLAFLPERPGDIRHSLSSIDRLSKKTIWKPEVSLDEGLRKTMEWFK